MIVFLYNFIMNIFLRIKNNNKHIALNATLRNVILEDKIKIYPKVTLVDCDIGRGTYIGNESQFINTKIGRYCSIAPNCKVVIGRHPVSIFASTHPSFFSTKKQSGFTYVDNNLFDEFKVTNTGRSVEIGNDVWLGYGTVILEGISIGDGAIVAAGAVVTKNVEPYSIVAGNPAKHLRYRFDDDTKNKLQKLKWWLLDEKWIEDNYILFSNVNLLLSNRDCDA